MDIGCDTCHYSAAPIDLYPCNCCHLYNKWSSTLKEENMSYVHNYEPMTEEKRPQDEYMDGRDYKFETLEHGGEYPDRMPQAIRAIDAQGRSCIYLPIKVDGKVVDSKGFDVNPEFD